MKRKRDENSSRLEKLKMEVCKEWELGCVFLFFCCCFEGKMLRNVDCRLLLIFRREKKCLKSFFRRGIGK